MGGFKQPVYFAPDDSFTSIEYTYSFSKYSCISWMYPIHIIFAYLVVLSGFLALLSRVVGKLRPYHYTFGRWYLIFMLWCMASSLVIHNTGLPMPILVSFLYLLFSITIGWNAIKVYTNKLANEVKQKMNIKINELLFKRAYDPPIDLKVMQTEQRNYILASKTFKQRLFSTKMLHGVMFAFSWAQMLGRTMVTNPFTSFSGCWTYPAYKSTVMGTTAYAVDSQSTPAFPMKEGAFIAIITAPTVIVIISAALLSTWLIYRSDTKMKEVSPTNSDAIIN